MFFTVTVWADPFGSRSLKNCLTSSMMVPLLTSPKVDILSCRCASDTKPWVGGSPGVGGIRGVGGAEVVRATVVVTAVVGASVVGTTVV